MQRANAVITRLHRLRRRDLRRFEDAVFLLVTRGIWDLDELDEAFERRSRELEVERERRRETQSQRSLAG